MNTMNMKALLVVLLALAFAPSGAPVPQGGLLCRGPLCDADLVVFPLPGWRVVGTYTDGRGRGYVLGDPGYGQPCDPCEDCEADVSWEYFGGATWCVTHGSDTTCGQDVGVGSAHLQTGCDEIPDGLVMQDTVNGTFNVDLYCPCQ